MNPVVFLTQTPTNQLKVLDSDGNKPVLPNNSFRVKRSGVVEGITNPISVIKLLINQQINVVVNTPEFFGHVDCYHTREELEGFLGKPKRGGE